MSSLPCTLLSVGHATTRPFQESSQISAILLNKYSSSEEAQAAGPGMLADYDVKVKCEVVDTDERLMIETGTATKKKEGRR